VLALRDYERGDEPGEEQAAGKQDRETAVHHVAERIPQDAEADRRQAGHGRGPLRSDDLPSCLDSRGTRPKAERRELHSPTALTIQATTASVRATVSDPPNGSKRVAAELPANLRDELEELARQNDRSVSAELRRAIVEHLKASPLGSRGAGEPVVTTMAAGSTALGETTE
jgi:hypothetical protein